MCRFFHILPRFSFPVLYTLPRGIVYVQVLQKEKSQFLYFIEMKRVEPDFTGGDSEGRSNSRYNGIEPSCCVTVASLFWSPAAVKAGPLVLGGYPSSLAVPLTGGSGEGDGRCLMMMTPACCRSPSQHPRVSPAGLATRAAAVAELGQLRSRPRAAVPTWGTTSSAPTQPCSCCCWVLPPPSILLEVRTVLSRALVLLLLLIGGVEPNPGPPKPQQSSRGSLPTVEREGHKCVLLPWGAKAEDACFRCGAKGHHAASCASGKKDLWKIWKTKPVRQKLPNQDGKPMQQQQQQAKGKTQQQKLQQQPQRKTAQPQRQQDSWAARVQGERPSATTSPAAEWLAYPDMLMCFGQVLCTKAMFAAEEDTAFRALCASFSEADVLLCVCPFGCPDAVFRPFLREHVAGHHEQARRNLLALETVRRDAFSKTCLADCLAAITKRVAAFATMRDAIVAAEEAKRTAAGLARVKGEAKQGKRIRPSQSPENPEAPFRQTPQAGKNTRATHPQRAEEEVVLTPPPPLVFSPAPRATPTPPPALPPPRGTPTPPPVCRGDAEDTPGLSPPLLVLSPPPVLQLRVPASGICAADVVAEVLRNAAVVPPTCSGQDIAQRVRLQPWAPAAPMEVLLRLDADVDIGPHLPPLLASKAADRLWSLPDQSEPPTLLLVEGPVAPEIVVVSTAPDLATVFQVQSCVVCVDGHFSVVSGFVPNAVLHLLFRCGNADPTQIDVATVAFFAYAQPATVRQLGCGKTLRICANCGSMADCAGKSTCAFCRRESERRAKGQSSPVLFTESSIEAEVEADDDDEEDECDTDDEEEEEKETQETEESEDDEKSTEDTGIDEDGSDKCTCGKVSSTRGRHKRYCQIHKRNLAQPCAEAESDPEADDGVEEHCGFATRSTAPSQQGARCPVSGCGYAPSDRWAPRICQHANGVHNDQQRRAVNAKTLRENGLTRCIRCGYLVGAVTAARSQHSCQFTPRAAQVAALRRAKTLPPEPNQQRPRPAELIPQQAPAPNGPIVVYTDGSAATTGAGAACWHQPGHPRNRMWKVTAGTMPEDRATNQRAELIAILASRRLNGGALICRTDSQWVIDGVRGANAVESHLDLWRELDLAQNFTLEKVDAHQGDLGNEAADTLAKLAAGVITQATAIVTLENLYGQRLDTPRAREAAQIDGNLPLLPFIVQHPAPSPTPAANQTSPPPVAGDEMADPWFHRRPQCRRFLYPAQWAGWVAVNTATLVGYTASSYEDRIRRQEEWLDLPRSYLAKEERTQTPETQPPKFFVEATERPPATMEGYGLTRREQHTKTLIRLNALGKAVRKLSAEANPVALTSDTINTLRALHPQDVVEDEASPDPPQTHIFRVEPRMLQSVVQRKMSRGSAPSLDGWTRELLLPLVQNVSLRRELSTLTADMLMGRISATFAARVRACAETPLRKPDGSLRPITPESAVAKLACLVGLRLVDKRCINFAPLQYGVGGDVEAAAVATQEMFTRTDVLVFMDATNAFNRISRSQVVRACFNTPGLASIHGLVGWLLPRRSFIGLYDKGDLIAEIPSMNGVRQGMVLGPLLFALTIQPTPAGPAESSGQLPRRKYCGLSR